MSLSSLAAQYKGVEDAKSTSSLEGVEIGRDASKGRSNPPVSSIKVTIY